MTDTHGLIPHQTGYYYITLEEDYVVMFQLSADRQLERSAKTEQDKKLHAARHAHAVAKAYISSVLEQLSDKQFKEGKAESRIWVFLSFPEIESRVHGGAKIRALKDAMKELIEDGYVSKRDNPDRRFRSKLYHMNFKQYRSELNALPKRTNEIDSANLPDDSAEMHDSDADLHEHDAIMHEPSGKFAPKNNNRLPTEETQSNTEGGTGAFAPTPPLSSSQEDDFDPETTQFYQNWLRNCEVARANGDPLPPRPKHMIVDSAAELLSESAKLKAIVTAQLNRFEVTPDMETPADGDGAATTQRMQAVKIGDNDAAVHGAGDLSARSGATGRGGMADAGLSGGIGNPARDAAPVGTGVSADAPVAPSQTVRGATNALAHGGGATPSVASESRAPGARKRSKNASETPEPKGPPVLPAEDAEWCTRTCLALFDYWRGAYLIGKFELMQASSCAKEMVAQYSRAEVEQAKARMDKDKYWVERGGADVCNVAKQIHRYARRGKVPAQAAIDDDPYSFASILKRQEEQERAAARGNR